MKAKQIIIFLLLAILLIALSYLLLSAIDKHMGDLLVALLIIFTITDIVLLVRFFLRYMNPSKID